MDYCASGLVMKCLWHWTCDQQVTGLTLHYCIAGQLPGQVTLTHMPSASEVTTVWCCRNLITLVKFKNNLNSDLVVLCQTIGVLKIYPSLCFSPLYGVHLVHLILSTLTSFKWNIMPPLGAMNQQYECTLQVQK